MKFKPNQQLVTKFPERMGNITIMDSFTVLGIDYYSVLTDYGNIVKVVSEESIENSYYLPEWEGTGETLVEKIKHRIELLEEALTFAKTLEEYK